MARQSAHSKQTHSGLRHWMQRTVKELNRVRRDFSPDAVHDLRVSLRRCRSLASGLAQVDPNPNWKAMNRASRKLFRRLGALRDLQVLQQWVEKLSGEDDPVRQTLTEVFGGREPELKEQAARAVESFDRHRWQQWLRTLPERARRLPPDGLVAQHLALERWEEARALHRRALRNRNPAAWHALRIGVKRFRYTVENFLPERHQGWGSDLKHVQDLLGEVHDLDVLLGTLPEAGALLDEQAAARWHATIEKERNTRLDEYRARMAVRNSLWAVWRAGLPAGERIEAAALAKLTAWAAALDPDTAHSRQVARLSLELYTGLGAAGFNGAFSHPRGRALLQAAALLHNTGRSEGAKGHHKAAFRVISALRPPLGWTQEEILKVAVIARYHCGAEPREKHKCYASIPAEERPFVRALAGVLRVADALDNDHSGRVRRVEVRGGGEYLLIRAAGWEETEESAELMGGRKHLLEATLERPIIVRAAPAPEPARVTQLPARRVAVAD